MIIPDNLLDQARDAMAATGAIEIDGVVLLRRQTGNHVFSDEAMIQIAHDMIGHTITLDKILSLQARIPIPKGTQLWVIETRIENDQIVARCRI